VQSALVSGVRASPILPVVDVDDDGNLIRYGGPIASPP